MAISTFKTFLDSDKTNTRTLLHEHIPLTGTIVSGTYGGNTVATGSEPHIKTFSHGMFDSVYDYPHLSSSSNHIFDISVGFHVSGTLSGSGGSASGLDNGVVAVQQDKKLNMYNQMAQILAGYDINGDITPFDQDGDFGVPGAANDTKNTSCVFISFSRMVVKDEIKKGTFDMKLGVGAGLDVHGTRNSDDFVAKITDTNAATSYKANSPAGEYGLLYATQHAPAGNARIAAAFTDPVGLIYYQAGVVVLTSSLFLGKTNVAGAHTRDGILEGAHCLGGSSGVHALGEDLLTIMTGSTIHTANNFVRQRILDVTFNNTTELNSSVYFCRANHNEFNYSSNRTYLAGSKIRVKSQAQDMPRSYITTVGLYSANNELMAVAKVSEPIRKDPTNEVTLRVRLDY